MLYILNSLQFCLLIIYLNKAEKKNKYGFGEGKKEFHGLEMEISGWNHDF